MIMAVPLGGDTPWQFTAGTSVDSQARWSPSGLEVAFLSDRPHYLPESAHPAGTQVYVQRRAGGEARRISAVGGEIQHISWSGDGSRVLIRMTDPEPDADRARRATRGDAFEVEELPRFDRLWSLDPAAGSVEPLSPPGLQVWEYGIAPNGAAAALIASDLPYEASWYRARLVLATLAGTSSAGGQVRTLYATRRQLTMPLFSPASAVVAVLECTWSDRGQFGGDLVIVDVDDGTARNLTGGRPLSVSWAEWEPDGRSLLACGYERGEIAVWRISLDGDMHTLWHADGTFQPRFQPRFSRSGSVLAVLRHDGANPVDLWTARIGEEQLEALHQVTQIHPQIAEWDLPTCSPITWQAADDRAISGFLVRPPESAVMQSEAPLPLLVLVHGGPAGLHTSAMTWHEWVGLAAAHGIAVFMPNPRGSLGWGTAFTEANLGDMGGADFVDIMAGVDYLVAEGIADPDRLAIGGWSYGGFMSAWAVSQTGRFKAAVMGAGLSDWRSFHGVSRLHSWDALFYGRDGKDADPYDLDGPYTRFSAITFVDHVHTPTLILHGECDLDVPIGQGLQFYRALRDRGIPVSMTVYPRAGHGPSERAQMRDVALRFIEWVCRYLGVEFRQQ
jgi:dipeptidyl aminopeptidase/acylaminoacyl peptidase